MRAKLGVHSVPPLPCEPEAIQPPRVPFSMDG